MVALLDGSSLRQEPRRTFLHRGSTLISRSGATSTDPLLSGLWWARSVALAVDLREASDLRASMPSHAVATADRPSSRRSRRHLTRESPS